MWRRLARARGGSTAMEFALTFPAVLLFVFAMFAVFSLVSCKRAMDVGIEKALRAAIVNSAGGQSYATAAYTTWSGVIWRDVGIRSTLSFTINGSAAGGTATFRAGDTLGITATYAWVSPASLRTPDDTSLWTSVTLTSSGAMMVMN